MRPLVPGAALTCGAAHRSPIRSTPWRAASRLTGVAVAVGLGAFALARGGYWPNSWSWATLAAVFGLATLISAGKAHCLSKREAVFASAVFGLAIWTWLSVSWSPSAGSALDGVRLSAYAFVVAFVLVALSRQRTNEVFGGVLVAVVLVSGYSLIERLFPDRFGEYDPVAQYRMSGPIGYWNGLAILAVIGLVLAVGFACRARALLMRAAAAASVVVLIAALYFTFGRAAWMALGFGLLVAIALDPRRLKLIAHTATLVPAVVATLLLSSHSDALTHRFQPAAAAAQDGHRLAIAIAVVAVCAAAANIGATTIERTIELPRAVPAVFAAVIAVTAVAAIGAVFVRYAGPVTLAQKAYRSFTGPPVAVESDLNKRLFSLSSNRRIDMWHAAWRDYLNHPVLGSGAASYEEWWNKYRPVPRQVRNAHSLYLETLAELGPLGLLVIAGVIALPLVAAVRVRHRALVPAAAGAFAAFSLHAAGDWDWQLAGVAVPALVIGAALLVVARAEERIWNPPARLRIATVAVLAALSGVAVYLVIATTAFSNAQLAAGRNDYAVSERQARKATGWMPWSGDAWRLLGEAQLALREPGASASLRKAIARDRTNWLTWFDLAAATSGREHARALAKARELNPLSPEIAQLVSG